MNDGDGTLPDCKVGREKNKEKIVNNNNNNDSDWDSKALSTCTNAPGEFLFGVCYLAFHTPYSFRSDAA